ncbi:RNA polymerase sigma-70 factor, ECF subfamily [Rhodococcus triatomae]|uniref:RNA polymerase sigma-70 factor, ECF subfamily n=2 Tax=Rhodococcus triatomae TaxID=300028 RepID=A0A1G8DWX5_9NOCA|nr:RNA polymerase sigma-70 factor, ECF subfamily [Rhodococcus triatomae]
MLSAVEAATDGRRQSVEEGIAILWPHVVRYCRARAADRAAHQVCLDVVRELPRIAEHRHVVREVYRVLGRSLAEIEDVPQGRVAGPLGRLDPDSREVITLRVIDGLSVRDTAAVLGLPVGKVLCIQHEAMRTL